jgi:ATP-dependent DNA helicase RecQ
VAADHAGFPDQGRTAVQDAFMRGKVPVMAATNAFGMGVDKADIRFVIHYDVPGSLEAYYQEAGRAGRDGRPSDCCLLFNFSDVRIQEFFLEGANPSKQIIEEVMVAIREGSTPSAATRNEMAANTAAGILERFGLVERRGDGSLQAAAEEMPEELPIDWENLELKATRDRERLAAVVGYAQSRTCRRHTILGYFTGETAPEDCAHCDVCLGWHHKPARELDDGERRIVRIALSVVARLNDRFGRGRLAKVLTGSKAKPVTDFGLDRLPTFGMLKGMPAKGVSDLLEVLADAELLKRRTIDGSGMPGGAVLSLTSEGNRVMRDPEAPLSLAWPESMAAREPANAASRARAKAGPGDGMSSGPEPDHELADALRRMRRARADEDHVPAYVVFSDKTLVAIAAMQPTSREALLEVPGIGPARLERYGDAILAVLHQHLR